MLIIKAIVISCFLIGMVMIVASWIGFVINSFKEGEPGWGFFALGLLLVSLAWLIARFIP